MIHTYLYCINLFIKPHGVLLFNNDHLSCSQHMVEPVGFKNFSSRFVETCVQQLVEHKKTPVIDRSSSAAQKLNKLLLLQKPFFTLKRINEGNLTIVEKKVIYV